MAAIQTTASGKVKVVYHYTPSNEIGPGNYRVVETQPAGYADGLETTDNVTPIPGSEKTDVIDVTITSRNDQKVTNHFGEVRASSVAGYVYHDRNKNGAFGIGDIRQHGSGNIGGNQQARDITAFVLPAKMLPGTLGSNPIAIGENARVELVK